jgi:hypothetical protein
MERRMTKGGPVASDKQLPK